MIVRYMYSLSYTFIFIVLAHLSDGVLVRPGGIEPPTDGLKAQCSAWLSYERMFPSSWLYYTRLLLVCQAKSASSFSTKSGNRTLPMYSAAAEPTMSLYI